MCRTVYLPPGVSLEVAACRRRPDLYGWCSDFDCSFEEAESEHCPQAEERTNRDGYPEERIE